MSRRVTRSRCVCTPRTRCTTGSRRVAHWSRSSSPALPQSSRRTLDHGVRIDSGFESGNEVSTYYDAMLAKVIAWGPTRRDAARMLAGALSRARLHGVVTNRDLLVAILRDQAFLDGQVSTDFFEQRPVVESTERMAPDEHLLLAAAVALAEHDRRGRRVQAGTPVAWRNVVSQPQRNVFALDDEEHTIEWFGDRNGYRPARGDARVLEASPSAVTLEIAGVSARIDVTLGAAEAAGSRDVYVDGPWARRTCARSHVSSTRPRRWPAGRCSRRCPGRSSASRSRSAQKSSRASRCWCSRP